MWKVLYPKQHTKSTSGVPDMQEYATEKDRMGTRTHGDRSGAVADKYGWDGNGERGGIQVPGEYARQARYR